MTLAFAANLIFTLLVVIGQVIVVLTVVFLIFRKNKILELFGRNATLFSFIVALAATLGSLFYSEVAGLEPCKLCWLQRIFMYPQAILFGIALWKKNGQLAAYNGLALSLFGAAIAGYHYFLQIGAVPGLLCAAGYSVSCSQRFAMNFSYITIPMMAFTAFTLIILFSAVSLRKYNF